jgi:monofunctional biosynthetic peptidoglycan transglycosylase
LWLLGWVLLWNWVNPGDNAFHGDSSWPNCVRKIRMLGSKRNGFLTSVFRSHLKRAIIASEDAKFVDHEGFDWDGMQKAMEKNQKKGRFVAGGSTITQQLAKNLFLTPNQILFSQSQRRQSLP